MSGAEKDDRTSKGEPRSRGRSSKESKGKVDDKSDNSSTKDSSDKSKNVELPGTSSGGKRSGGTLPDTSIKDGGDGGAGPEAGRPPITPAGFAGQNPFLAQAQAMQAAAASAFYQQQMMSPWGMPSPQFSPFMPNMWQNYNHGLEWDQSSVYDSEDLGKVLSRQNPEGYVLSEDDSDEESVSELSTGEKPSATDNKKLPPLKLGMMAAMMQEQQENVTASEVGKAVNPHLSQTFDRYLTEKFEQKNLDGLVAKYPGVDNIPRLRVKKTDEEIFLSLPGPIKSLDKDLQKIQDGLMAGLSALTPMVHEILERGEGDPTLDKISPSVGEGIHTLVMTNSLVSHQRVELHKPYMKPEFLRAIAKVKQEDMDHSLLYGGVVDTAVNNYEKARKAAKGAMKEQQVNKKQGGNPPPSKKPRFQGSRPQNKQGTQNSYGHFHYGQQGGFAPGGQNFPPSYATGFDQQVRQNFRPRNPGFRPRAPTPRQRPRQTRVRVFRRRQTNETVCRGTSNGLSHQGGDATRRYEILKTRYTNCTLVDGNLEIIFLDHESDYDLSFLSDIREITGYMVVVGVYAEVLPMTSLRIIRGTLLFPKESNEIGDAGQYSLFISNNYAKQPEGSKTPPTIGLRKLLFTSLREIIAGDVFLNDNQLLCNDNTIMWQDIVIGENVRITTNQHQNGQCKPCHSSCEEFEGKRLCWGPEENECQLLTKYTCSKQCETRCYGKQPNQCCHAQCAGGCTGPRRTNCWACQQFSNEDECVAHCPPQQIYDQQKYKFIDNPEKKFAFGGLCVDECPTYLVQESGACVKECGADKYAVNRTCIKCNGPCPKTCAGFEDHDSYLTYNDLERFKGCTVINGNLQLLDSTFSGDRNIPEVHPSNLSVFNEVRKITGFLSIQGRHADFKSADFLSNLEVIYGRTLFRSQYSLAIVGTSFLKLGLTKLKKVMNGRILLFANPDLCYIDQTNYTRLLYDSNVQRVDIRGNRAQDQCISNNFICDAECSVDGCWGPARNECMSCQHFKLGDMCRAHCEHKDKLYGTENGTCHHCDDECLSTCQGAGNGQCDHCKNVKDGPFCVSECPIQKYADSGKVCQQCHDNCEGGCTGPRNDVGPGACNSCSLAQVDDTWDVEKCLPPDSHCPGGYFLGQMRGNSSLTGNQVCRKCNPLCRTCNGPGTAYCIECRYFVQEGACVKDCFPNYYADNKLSKCLKCHPQCQQCDGPNVTDCLRCRTVKVMLESNNEGGNHTDQFYCADSCPLERPISENVETEGGYETICSPEGGRHKALLQQGSKVNWIIGGVIALGLVVGIVSIVGFILCRQRAKSEENKMKIAARFSGLEEGEPLTPTNVSPDMATMRLITESELRKGNIIGSGAFGTVYKGMWVPTDENVKIPVAIKVLQESTSPSQNKELLEEARVMASVDHPYCVRILAVCMTAQMMLITQLMPFGCLLDYVRKNRSNIGSKVLLNWCTQIARGMTYLEERGVVHRDLAARNVLIQSPANIKITDFGLAKLLDINEEEYKSSGGKMPIKWLALECIQHRIFTHKSDVWSYGVTVWELFTYGQRPYDNLHARDVPDLLEKGERLPQPSICTIDVYMIMIKCWMLDAESRPSFKELAEEFSKMARDPGRYLVIQGDKLMRLPSQSINKEDLLRSMSVAEEGTEEMVDAEDYLQPTSTLPPENGVVGKQMHDTANYDNDREKHAAHHVQPGCSNPYYTKHKPDPAKQFCRNGMNSRDSVNSRYTPDPCNVLDDPKDGELNGVALPHILQPPLEPSDCVDSNKLPKIPMPIIDEDDYLTPKSSQPVSYMDLIEGKDYLEPDGQYLEPQSPAAMDNPEYFQTTQDPDIDGLKSHKDPPRLRSPGERSTNSEPEYCNDHDRFQYKTNRGMPMSRSLTESVV